MRIVSEEISYIETDKCKPLAYGSISGIFFSVVNVYGMAIRVYLRGVDFLDDRFILPERFLPSFFHKKNPKEFVYFSPTANTVKEIINETKQIIRKKKV